MREGVIKTLLELKPTSICIGLLNRDEIAYLIGLNITGELKHILFLDCDSVECWIECVWS